MTSWIPYVFVRVVIFFIAGILIGVSYQNIIPENIITLIIVSLLICYLVVFAIQNFLNRKIGLLGFIGLICVFVSGYACTVRKKETRDPDHLIHIVGKLEAYQVIVTQLAQEREKSWKFETELIGTRENGKWRKSSGKILIYLSKEDFKLPYHYGDILFIRGAPQRVQPPGNPGEFDYRQFLEYKNIYHQHFLRENDVEFIRNDPPYKFLEAAFTIRVKADSTLKNFVHGEREQATASALVLGVTDGLDDDLLSAYSATGAMHVLAVSGLHISIIYLILAFVLKPVLKVKHGHVFLAIISIVILWSYSFVTGLSPSVLRAVVMFTFMAIARASKRQTNIYNTLAAAAFGLLIYDPFMIMSVGFQLSFLAVLGIVYVQPLLQRWLEPRSWILNEVWKISCVAVAAQIVTFPLCILYFHQFPNYFLLSNLFVIPGSFVVLLAGIAVLTFGFIEPAGVVLGLILEWSIKVLNWIVFFIESFPFAMIENISISTAQCWTLMTITGLVLLMFVKRQLHYLKTAVVFSLLFLTLRWEDMSDRVQSRHLIIYKIPGHTAIDLIDHGQAHFYADSSLVNDPQKIRFHIRPNRQLYGIQNVESATLNSVSVGYQLMNWNGKRILRITNKKFRCPESVKADFLIISNNATGDPSKLPDALLSVPIILDSSNSFYFADKMVRNAAKLHVNVYSVIHQGAFKYRIEPSQL